MDKWKKKSVELLSRLVIGDTSSPSVAPYYPAKCEALFRDSKKYFPRSRPEKHGASAARLFSMLSELESDKRANIHNILVIKDGEVISEASHPGYGIDMPHLAHSMSKTVTGIAIGMLFDTDRVTFETGMMEFFPEYEPRDKRFHEITVDHLLRMASGIPFAEVATVTSGDWLSDVFDCELKFNPGEKFDYNSINSYLLSVIVTKLTGLSLSEFIEERLFAPLGIKNYFWEKSAQGYDKGGWGLFLSPESFAKIGYMLLEGGEFEGKRILSRYFVEEMTTRKSVQDGSMGDYNYGYHVWVGKEESDFLLNGMFGQNVWVCPKNNTLVVINSGNSELFQRSAALSIIRKYLGGDYSDDRGPARFYLAFRDKELHFFEGRHWIRPAGYKSLLHRLGILKDPSPLEPWYSIVGEYKLGKNNVGMLPFFLCLMQNNLERSLESISISVTKRHELRLGFTESGVEYNIGVGLHKFATSVLDFRGERYLVSAMAEAIEDEDRNRVFKIELLLPEMPNTRMIKITKCDAGIYIRFSETPDSRLVTQFIDGAFDMSPLMAVGMAMLKRNLGEDFLEAGIARLFNPSLVGVKVGSPRFEDDLAKELARLSAASERFAPLNNLIKTFIKDEEKEKSERRGPVAMIGDLIRRRRASLARGEDIEREVEERSDGGEDSQESAQVVKNNAEQKSTPTLSLNSGISEELASILPPDAEGQIQ